MDWSGKARLRSEHVDDDRFTDDSFLVSIAAQIGAVWEPTSSLSFAATGEAVGEIAGRFDDGEGAPRNRGVIPDPSLLNLNELFAEYRGLDGVRVRIGRQTLSFDDERFVGAVAFRQNAQSFDAIRTTLSGAGGLSVDVAQVVGVARPLGARGSPRRLESESLLIRAALPFRYGSVVGYRYGLDLGEDQSPTPLAGGRSITYGAAVKGQVGERPASLSYHGELAQQENRTTGETVAFGRAKLGLAFERVAFDMSYDRFAAGTEAFQTPLGTNRAFQGHADVFLVTPATGLADTALGIRYQVGDFGPIRRVGLSVRGHRFDPTTAGPRYGHELDVIATAQWRRFTLSTERAAYVAEGFGDDVTRWWLTVATSF
ncbi:MAG: alginate export family protein [Pseudomonadota bacterium]